MDIVSRFGLGQLRPDNPVTYFSRNLSVRDVSQITTENLLLLRVSFTSPDQNLELCE